MVREEGSVGQSGVIFGKPSVNSKPEVIQIAKGEVVNQKAIVNVTREK